jgi:hypothetical protein
LQKTTEANKNDITKSQQAQVAPWDNGMQVEKTTTHRTPLMASVISS